jgi:hypothetical protein
MSLFCLLWTPLVLLLWVSLNAGNGGNSGGVLALVLGSVVSVLHYLFCPPINTAGFGLSLGLYALVNVVLIPVVLPFVVFVLLAVPGFFKGGADPAKFVLFWLVPAGITGAIGWSARHNPLYLILVPLLWTALALGIAFFARLVQKKFFPRIIPLLPVMLLMPLIAAGSFWAFYRQTPTAGFILLAVLSIPSVIALAKCFFPG